MLTIASFGSRRRGRLAGFLCVLSLLGLGLAGIATIACFRRATTGTRPGLVLVSLAFFISLALRASGARLLECDVVLVNTPLGPSTPVHTQDSSWLFLPLNGAWPSPVVKMSSSVGSPPRDGSRVLYASRSSGSGK